LWRCMDLDGDLRRQQTCSILSCGGRDESWASQFIDDLPSRLSTGFNLHPVGIMRTYKRLKVLLVGLLTMAC